MADSSDEWGMGPQSYHCKTSMILEVDSSTETPERKAAPLSLGSHLCETEEGTQLHHASLRTQKNCEIRKLHGFTLQNVW